MPPRPDWVVAFDDQLTERSRRCLLCGKRAEWMDVRLIAGLALLSSLCTRCHTGPGWRAVDALWAARLAGDLSTIVSGNL